MVSTFFYKIINVVLHFGIWSLVVAFYVYINVFFEIKHTFKQFYIEDNFLNAVPSLINGFLIKRNTWYFMNLVRKKFTS